MKLSEIIKQLRDFVALDVARNVRVTNHSIAAAEAADLIENLIPKPFKPFDNDILNETILFFSKSGEVNLCKRVETPSGDMMWVIPVLDERENNVYIPISSIQKILESGE